MSSQQNPSAGGGPRVPGLEEVLAALERGLVVRLIMSTELNSCLVTDSAASVLRDPSRQEYSQFPVRQEERIVGVLLRNLSEQCTQLDVPVAELMRPLREGDIVAADTSIAAYIEHATRQPFHLVIDGHEIAGIVTKSDLLRHPVRLYLFNLLAHMETAMLGFIERNFGEPCWKNALTAKRLQKVEDRRNEDRLDDQSIDLVYYTQWADKRHIIWKLAGWKDRNSFKKDLKELETLRDQVMHANKYPRQAAELHKACEKAQYWIKCLGVSS